jgi:hypothetical protein
MKIAIVTGSRKIAAEDESLVREVVRELVARGYTIYVGDAKGVDATAASVCYDCLTHPEIFSPILHLGRTPSGLAERSTRMVKEALANGFHCSDGRILDVVCVGFPYRACPAGILPAKSWRTVEPEGSETWSILALCVGHNIETWIIPIDDCPLLDALTFPEFLEVTGWNNAFNQQNFNSVFSWHFTPAPTILSHAELADGWTEHIRDENNPM